MFRRAIIARAMPIALPRDAISGDIKQKRIARSLVDPAAKRT
jgi:hypothetical protein